MKILLMILFSLSLFSFEGNKLYECSSKYRIVNGSPYEYTSDEEASSRFSLVFNKRMNRLKTSDGLVYAKAKKKTTVFFKKLKVKGRSLTYTLKLASEHGLYKSAFVRGYGTLVNEYVLCSEVKKKKINKSKDINAS